MPNNPKSRQSNLVVQDLENEILIYDLKINKAYCLNETSAMVWQFCDGKNSVSEISRLMTSKLKTQVSAELVWLALDGLQRENLLGNDAEFTAQFAGFSRRQAIKKVGLASMIALPFISSAFAPMATSAQTTSR